MSIFPSLGFKRVVHHACIALTAGVCMASGPYCAGAAGTTWTTGHKKILIIPVRFTDLDGPSDAPGPGGYLSGWGEVVNGTTTAALSEFFEHQSYGRFTVEFTLLPEIDLGVSYAVYNSLYPGTSLSKYTLWHEKGSFADDVRAKARADGLLTPTPEIYDTDNYDLDIIACGFIPGQGTGSSGITFGKGVFALNYKVLAHEICHNLGLQHANGVSRATYYSPLRPGTFFSNAYGDVYDLMGDKDTTSDPVQGDNEINAYWRYQLGWLTDDQITDPLVSGTYRIHAFDQGMTEPGKRYALRIARDADRTYWCDFRWSVTNAEDTWVRNGLEIRFGGQSITATSGNTVLIDMTPGSRGAAYATYSTMTDAPLAVGRTYTDAEAGLHITPVRKGGTQPESLDVVVNHGTFPGNNAPTITINPTVISLNTNQAQVFAATASDPDGDLLCYNWEFDDPYVPGGMKSEGLNSDATLATQGSHAWSRNGVYLVRCTASDMKGRTTTATAEVTVTGGSAGGLAISGVVRDEAGNPIQGAVVNNFKPASPNAVAYGAWNFAASNETGADGRYMVQLPPIGAYTYNLTAIHKGFAFNCSSPGGAVTVSGANVMNVDFTRIRSTRMVSGGVYVAGRGYDPATDGPLTISDGVQSVQSGVGAWQMTVADGAAVTFTAVPSNPAYTVTPYFPNPCWIADDFNLLHFNVKIPGMMPETGFASAGASSDDTVGTVNIPVVLTPPNGQQSWPADQSVFYYVDPGGTAEYGVDYIMAGGRITFYGGKTPSPYTIPLRIIHDGIPKTKTVVIRLAAANTITNLGSSDTFTYTISNPGMLDGRTVGDFNNSGCTDLEDFLFLLDYWMTVSPIGGGPIELGDFLALLDNWRAGASCS